MIYYPMSTILQYKCSFDDLGGYLTRKRTKIMFANFRKIYGAQCRSSELLAAAEKIPKGKARDDMIKTVNQYILMLKASGKLHKGLR